MIDLVNRAYLDSNVFIDAIEGDETLSRPSRKLLEVADRRFLVTSELTLAEVLAPGRKRRPSADTKRDYLELIVWSNTIDLQVVSRAVLLETTKLREHANLKLVNAIHLATAIMNACQYFVTRDMDFARMPDGMEKITADSPKLAEMVR